jgi:hypothetical protein
MPAAIRHKSFPASADRPPHQPRFSSAGIGSGQWLSRPRQIVELAFTHGILNPPSAGGGRGFDVDG